MLVPSAVVLWCISSMSCIHTHTACSCVRGYVYSWLYECDLTSVLHLSSVYRLLRARCTHHAPRSRTTSGLRCFPHRRDCSRLRRVAVRSLWCGTTYVLINDSFPWNTQLN